MKHKNYIDETLAIGMVMMDSEGYDKMMVIHGIIKQNENGFYMESKDEAPFEMSNGWLEKIKPTGETMGKEFQGAKYCLIIASLQK